MVPLAFLLVQAEISVERVQALVDRKDVEGLTAVTVIPPREQNPFRVIQTGGAYGVGRFGWKALPLKSPDGKQSFVVLSTALTSQDVGEIVLRRQGSRLAYVPETDAMGVKIHSHSLDLRFVPAEKRAILTDRVTFSAPPSPPAPLPRKGEGSFFIFRMSPNYRVSSITQGTSALRFSQAGGVVLVKKPSGKATYTIKYGGIVDLPQYAASINSQEATLTNDYWYPMVARQPAPYEIAIRAPKDWTAVGQGELVSTVESGAEKVTRYRMDLPVVYYSVSAGPYKTVFGQGEQKRYWLRSMRMSPERMAMQPELYSRIFDFYEAAFAKYPFSSYGALDSEIYGGGALEAYSFATYGGGLPGEDAHEPAHTWWGGILNNTYLGSFWNESFAVYSDGLYRRQTGKTGADTAFISVAHGEAGYTRFPVQGGGAAVGPDASSLGYGKGALVLQMLEQIIGAPGMKKAMAEWIRVDRGRAVDWPDFERVVMSLFPDKDLKPFFDDWLRKPGYARISLADATVDSGHVEFALKFEGTQYRMPLDVMVEAEDGSRYYSIVRTKGSGTYNVEVPLNKRMRLLSVDPWLRALRSIDETEYADEIQRHVFRFKRYTDPAHPEWLPGVGRSTLDKLPEDLNGVFIVGHPQTTPVLRDLMRRSGISLSADGRSVMYGATSVKLDNGAAFAVVDLAGGGKCVIGLGKTKLFPNAGRAKVALVDGLGRYVSGFAEPKRSGNLTSRF